MSFFDGFLVGRVIGRLANRWTLLLFVAVVIGLIILGSPSTH